MQTRYDIYLQKQSQDSEFRAKHALAREKVKLDMMLERLREQIKQEKDPKTLLRSVNRISCELAKAAP